MKGNVCHKTKQMLDPMVHPQPLASTNVAELVPPGRLKARWSILTRKVDQFLLLCMHVLCCTIIVKLRSLTLKILLDAK